MAILETISFVTKHQMNDITIFSDSKSVLQALKNINFKNNTSHLINKIRDSINKFVKRGGRIKLIWIPSHCGITGNERADSLAKEVPRSGIDYQVCTSNRDFSASWKHNQFERFFEWCKSSGENRATWYIENCFTPTRFPWFQFYDISRKSIVSINRMRCGHTSLKFSLARFNIVPSGKCSECGSPEILDHIFWECSRFQIQRFQFFKKTNLSILFRFQSGLY
ncbi:Reverse transcriptase domain-containing protein [Camponotus japonicus]